MNLTQLTGNPKLYVILHWLFSKGAEPVFNLLRSEIQLRDGERVLDVGCGTGSFARLFPNSYTGIDPSEKYIAFARTRHRDADFRVMDALRMTFPDGSFNHIICIQVSHHLSDDILAAAVREMKRVCGRGGRVYLIDTVWPRKRNLIRNFLFSIDLGKHQRSFEQLRRILAAEGFEVLSQKLERTFPRHYSAFVLRKGMAHES